MSGEESKVFHNENYFGGEEINWIRLYRVMYEVKAQNLGVFFIGADKSKFIKTPNDSM